MEVALLIAGWLVLGAVGSLMERESMKPFKTPLGVLVGCALLGPFNIGVGVLVLLCKVEV